MPGSQPLSSVVRNTGKRKRREERDETRQGNGCRSQGKKCMSRVIGRQRRCVSACLPVVENYYLVLGVEGWLAADEIVWVLAS